MVPTTYLVDTTLSDASDYDQTVHAVRLHLLCRKSNFVVTCALANKLARIAWALTARQQTYVA
ncbi:hypothetical protein DN615_31550 [Klebsiella pneumoniae]|nr:hypothetical protein DN615_31550 [Klebsiella pneumoniae]